MSDSQSSSKGGMLASLKDMLPSFLTTEIPLPAFLTTPIPGTPSLRPPSFGNPRAKRYARRPVRARPRPRPAEVKRPEAKLRPGQFLLEGTIESGSKTRFAINGSDFALDANTWVVGQIKFGAYAKIKGTSRGDNEQVATQVIILKN